MWALIRPCWLRSITSKMVKRWLRLFSTARISRSWLAETRRYIASETTSVAPRVTATITPRRKRPTLRFTSEAPPCRTRQAGSTRILRRSSRSRMAVRELSMNTAMKMIVLMISG